MDQDTEHAELFLNLYLTGFRPNLQDVVWVHEGVIEQSVQLMVLVEFVILL